MGLLGVIFPEQYGGAGLGYIEYALAIEELARVDGSIGLIVAAHNSLCSNHIFKFGTEAQKKKYLVPLASGKAIGAWSLTEPEAGSDAGGTRTTAVREGKFLDIQWSEDVYDERALRGFLRGDGGDGQVAEGRMGSARSFWKRGWLGFKPGKKENKLGMRASDTSEVIFRIAACRSRICWDRKVKGLPGVLTDSGRWKDFDCGAGAGDGARCAGSGDEIREAAEAVWSGDQRISGDSV